MTDDESLYATMTSGIDLLLQWRHMLSSDGAIHS